MRIHKIKLAGFKSFVDPTTLHLPGNLTGIVGPNGCGKSNIIDAMMWVMGESSAKHLRGDSMADVIFSGSSTRKPVGQASVELVFDNSDGALGGAYAAFAEISIKRTVARDGVSSYFLNGTRCRRKDIVDVFLGTGLGVRGGYSVIEQGMISRVIEAKPEELRNFLEEAAGISRYKERRRETENRMRHTHENLARVNDVREELAKQLGHLQRQARAAERYQELKGEERTLEAELIGLRWRRLEGQRSEQVSVLQTRETAVEAALASVRSLEARQIELRAEQSSAQDAFNARQSAFYARSAEVSRLEQTLQHNEDRRKGLEQDLTRARFNLEETSRLHGEDTRRQEALSQEIEGLSPEMDLQVAAEEAGAEALRRVEASAEEWQQSWDSFNREQSEASRLEHAEQVRLELLQKGHGEAQTRAARLHEEQQGLAALGVEAALDGLAAELAAREAEYDRLTEEQQAVRTRLQAARQAVETLSSRLHTERSALQRQVGEEASLRALQQAALGRDTRALNGWLAQHGFADKPLLAGQLQIESGWELAVEVALRLPLSTLCDTDSVRQMAVAPIGELPIARLAGLEPGALPAGDMPRPEMPPLLGSRVSSSLSVQSLLAGVYAVDDLAQALALRARLQAHESAITPQGVWVGPNWVQLPGKETVEAGVLSRQRALEALGLAIERARAEVAATEQLLTEARAQQASEEGRERSLAETLQRTFASVTQSKSQISLKQAERSRVAARSQAITHELAQLASQSMEQESTLENLRGQVETLRARLDTLTTRGEALNQQRREVQAALETARTAWRATREARHAVALRLEGLRSTAHSLVQAIARNARLVEELKARCVDLESAMNDTLAPREALAAQLQVALGERQGEEQAMRQSREVLEACEAALRRTDEEGVLAGRELSQCQQALEQARLEERALQVRTQELEERLVQQEQVLETVLAALAPEADEDAWRQRLETVAQRITRLGPINLAAIDEFAQVSERKTYLDNQLEDLNQALATLQEAMQKIDRETRTRFRETFDAVNEGMQRLFPVLFGGGQASLELTQDDLLEAGVTVMARPPGKRNSTIHLLSGGEKALTALAFVFSLFELNPAPFCLLDEVDAPLDDANVVRLTELLKSMADRVQFLFISHNKITMEIASQLIGVTMHEAGVSRLVSVNMDEAVALAQTA